MTGLVALVRVAELLGVLTGSDCGACQLATDILSRGAAALPNRHDDINVAARYELAATGVLTPEGLPVSARAAELVVVCEILAAASAPVPPSPPEPRLVLTAPQGTAQVSDAERLDGFVLDVIRQATTTLHIGGAFWNEEGFDMLDAVLLPAVEQRGVATTIYVNTPGDQYLAELRGRLDVLRAAGTVSVRWFVGPKPTMLHAKFVIRDRSHGYLGTANLTSWGMSRHVEAGIELTSAQSNRFVTFIEQLDLAGLFDGGAGSST